MKELLEPTLIKQPDFYHYKGSLTTPHCNEIVSWFVYKYPLDVSAETIKIFEAKWIENKTFSNGFGNGRPVQPLNGRPVYEISANVMLSGGWRMMFGMLGMIFAFLTILALQS